MTELPKSEGRIELVRSRSSRVMHVVGIVVVGVILLIAGWYLLDWYWYRNPFDAVIGLLIAVVVIPFGFVLFDQLFLKIVLTDKFISFQTWHGTPHVYGYGDIADIENVVVDDESSEFRGSHVKLSFSDGRSFRIGEGLITAREFRKLLTEKSGRVYRKKRRPRPWWKKWLPK